MSELLHCQDLTKKYGGITALENLNLTVESGKIIGLLGPNGSGKTTFIKLVNGLLTPTWGSIWIDGKIPGVDSKKVVSYLPDNNFLNSWMTVSQLVDFFCDFYDDFRKELAYEMFAKLDIEPSRKLKTLSKGNKEQVCLILILSRNAKLYVLDEPIAAVDPAARDYVISTIINNYNPEASVIMSTHLIADIDPILDEAIFLNRGKVVLHKSVEDIRTEYGKSVDELFREEFRW